MSCHSFTAAMKLFIVKIMFAIIVMMYLSVPEASGQPTNPNVTSAPVVTTPTNKSTCDQGYVWSPTRNSCKLKTDSLTCTGADDCTDYANCVQRAYYYCLRCRPHFYPRPYYYPYPYHHNHYVVYNGGGGSSGGPKPPPPPPKCQCKHGQGYNDGTCPPSGAVTDKHIWPSFMLFMGTLLLVSRKILCS